MMKLNKYDIILGILILAEIVLCLYIALVAKSGTDPLLCKPGSGCENVQNSIYGTFFGIKLAWFGVIAFCIFLLLFLIARVNKNLYWMFFTASIIGAAFAICFISLQAIVLKQYCRDCMIIDSIMVLLLIIIVFEFIDFRKEITSLEKTAEKAVRRAL